MLYARLAFDLQPGGETETVRSESSVCEHLHPQRQDGEARGDRRGHPAAQKQRMARPARIGLDARSVYVQFLHARHLVRRHGQSSESQCPQRLYRLHPQQDPADPDRQDRSMHAGDHLALRGPDGRRLSAACINRSKPPSCRRPAQLQQTAETHFHPAGIRSTAQFLRGPPFVGHPGAPQRHPHQSDQRRDGARERSHHPHLLGFVGTIGGG